MVKKSERDRGNILGKEGFSRGRVRLSRGQGGPLSKVPMSKPLSIHTHYETGPVFSGDVILKALFPIDCVVSDVAVLVYGDAEHEGKIKIRMDIETSTDQIKRTREVTRGVISSIDEGINLSRGDIITLSLDDDSAQTSDILISFVARAGIG